MGSTDSSAGASREAARRIGSVLAILLLGGLASATMYRVLGNRETRLVQSEFELDAAERIRAIERECSLVMEPVRGLTAFFVGSESVTRAEFTSFARMSLAPHPAILALEWAPLVTADERAAYEAAARREGIEGFEFTEHGADAEPTTAGTREEYFPVYYIEPLEPNRAAIGLDLASEAVRRAAIETARDTGAITASGAICLVQDPAAGSGVIIFGPIYDCGAPPESVQQRRAALDSLVLCVIQVDRVIDQALSLLAAREMDITLADVTDPDDPRQLYATEWGDGTSDAGGLEHAMRFDMGGRAWRTTLVASEEYLAGRRSSLPGVTLVLGLVLTVVLAGYVAMLSGRTARIERIVRERTGSLEQHAEKLAAANAALRASERERDQFFSLSLELFCLANPDGRFDRVNPAWERTLGYTAEEMCSRPWIEFVHPDDVASTIEEVSKLKHGIDTLYFENRYRCKNGGYRWLAWTCPAPQPDDTTLYAAARDVTDLKHAAEAMRDAKEAAESASLAKTQFLANMSHELRTPLNAIMGYSHLLAQDAAARGDGGAVDDLDKIQESGRHLLSLINELLDLSKIEAGRMELHPERIDVPKLVEETVATVRPLAERNGNELTASCAEGVVWMIGDPMRIRQVLMNLLSNACKFTERGQVRLEVVRPPESDQSIRFIVSDTGIGMTPEQTERIFDVFVQGDASTTRRFGGTGLGLTITRRFCEMMNGRIDVTSTPGEGSVFVVELPMAASVGARRSGAAGAASAEAHDGPAST